MEIIHRREFSQKVLSEIHTTIPEPCSLLYRRANKRGFLLVGMALKPLKTSSDGKGGELKLGRKERDDTRSRGDQFRRICPMTFFGV